MYKLGVDIGGTKINIGLIDEQKNIVYKQTKKLPYSKSHQSVLKDISETLNVALTELNISLDQIRSCGMGVPGTVSSDGKTALKVPNLGWENVCIADEFETMTGISTRLIQDSRAAAWGEYMAGNGQDKQIVVCVTLGTGIGTGIVIGGKIFDGALGGAGELGHIPVVQNGRECGCGKKGCLECYVAGKGLEITAKEVFNIESTASDVFDLAENGDQRAKGILNEAIRLLGNAIVSMINLISPDCLLFSGGMSSRRELFVNPLIEYIKQHSYCLSAGDELFIGLAKLGENSPMVGAALLPEKGNDRKTKLSASLMCADFLHLESELRKLEDAGIDYLHFDVMDGHFVPNLMLPMEFVNKIRKGTRLPYDIHLMTENPENVIPKLKLKEGDIVSVHLESTPHVQRALNLIRDSGAKAAVAINPSTPVESVRELLEDISMILIMTVNPGYAGQKIVAQSFDKIARMRKYLDNLGYKDIMIEVDGNCSFENVPKMYAAGADMFVVGSSSVFSPNMEIKDATKKLNELIRRNKK